jgi:hypothetical protein
VQVDQPPGALLPRACWGDVGLLDAPNRFAGGLGGGEEGSTATSATARSKEEKFGLLADDMRIAKR